MCGASGRMAIDAVGGRINPTPGRLAVHTGLVDVDRMIDQDLVLGGYVQVFMALSAGAVEIGDMGFGMLHRGRQNVMVSMTILALRHILALSIMFTAVGLNRFPVHGIEIVQLGGIEIGNHRVSM